jgi:hypothetical protein
MVTLIQTMDPHALTIVRDGEWIGHLMWHTNRSHRIVLNSTFSHLSIDELETVLAKYKEIKKSNNNGN